MKRGYLQHVDTGFAFRPAFNGRGYAFEAAQALLNTADANGYHPVLATLLPQNHRSIKLLKSLGFRFQKELDMNNQTLLVYNNLFQAD